MRKRLVSVALAALMGISAHAYTDQEAQTIIHNLNDRVETLQSNLDPKVSTNPKLSILEASITEDIVHLDDEYETLFGKLPDTTFEVELLRKKKRLGGAPFVIGGSVSVTAQYWYSDQLTTGVANIVNQPLLEGSAVDMSGASFDILTNLTEWTTLMASFNATSLSSDPKQSVNRFYVSFGDTDQYPLFMLVGRTHLPFGIFSGGGPVASSLTKSAFKLGSQEQLWVGFDNQTLNTNIALFNSPLHKDLSNFVYSMYLNGERSGYEYTLGMGYMNDIRATSSGFGKAFTAEGANVLKNEGRIDVVDLNASVAYGDWTLAGEYVQTLHSVRYNSGLNLPGLVSDEGKTDSNPSSYYVMASYAPLYQGMHTVLSLAYSETHGMPGVKTKVSNQPVMDHSSFFGQKNQWVFAYNVEMFHNTFVGLEYQQLKTYNHESAKAVSVDLNYYF